MITLTLMMNFLTEIVLLPCDLLFISLGSFLEEIPQSRCYNYNAVGKLLSYLVAASVIIAEAALST